MPRRTKSGPSCKGFVNLAPSTLVRGDRAWYDNQHDTHAAAAVGARMRAFFTWKDAMLMKKTATLLLLLGLLAALLAGCGGEGTARTETSAPEETPEETLPPETPVPAEELEALETARFDFDNAYAAHSPETVVLTVGETPVNWTKYEGALAQLVYELNTYYGISDLSEELEEGVSIADWALDWTEDYMAQLAMLHSKAAEQELSLTEEDLAGIDADIQEQAEAYFDGDVDALFAEMHVPEELYRYQAEAALFYDKLFVSTFGEMGEKLSEADAVAYVADQGYLNAKHILWLFTDDEGAELSDEDKDARRAEAAQVLEMLREAKEEQREELFDSLMAQYSQDPGLESFPDGYYFQTGDMVRPFEDAAASLAAGELSELVESDYGVHLLYRPAMRADHIFSYDSENQPYTLRYMAADGLFANVMDDWLAEQEVVYAEGFEHQDLDGLFAYSA